MSTPATETLEREKDKLYLTELIRRLGVPDKTMRSMLPGLEKNYGSGPKIILGKWRRATPEQRIDFIDRVSHPAETGVVGMRRAACQISWNGAGGVWLQP